MKKIFTNLVLKLSLALMLTTSAFASNKREADTLPEVVPHSKRAKIESSVDISRVSTHQTHVEYLQKSLSKATRSVLITSNGVDREAFENANLYRFFGNLINKGVRVYIYNIDSKDIDGEIYNFFQKSGIFYDVAFTHAKILAIDNKIVSIGSYNWLSKANTWDNATLCLEGKECGDLSSLIWYDLKFYRNLQFGNQSQLAQYVNDPGNFESDSWHLNSSTNLHYFHSLQSHCEFISHIFEDAKNRIILCSPFINEISGYQGDFNRKI